MRSLADGCWWHVCVLDLLERRQREAADESLWLADNVAQFCKLTAIKKWRLRLTNVALFSLSY